MCRGMAVPRASTNGSPSARTDFTWKGKQYSIVMGEDYPYAADGLLIWKALRKWFLAYLSLYYTEGGDVAADSELSAWCGWHLPCCACLCWCLVKARRGSFLVCEA